MALPPTNPPGLVRDAEDLNKVVNGDGTTNRAGDSLPPLKSILGVVEARRDSAILAIDSAQSQAQSASTAAIQSIQQAEADTQGALDDAVNRIITEGEQAAASAGWFVIGDFADGFEYTARNQVGRDSTGELWSYNGSLPFTVTAGTTPSEPDYTNRGDAALRSDLSDESDLALGSSLIRRNVVALSSLKDLGNPRLPRREDLRYDNMGFYDGSMVGGGSWKWKENEPKSNHNGGTIVDPDRLSAWNGTQGDLATLFESGNGSGFGCYVRVRPNNNHTLMDWFGMVDDADISLCFDLAVAATPEKGTLYGPSSECVFTSSNNCTKSITLIFPKKIKRSPTAGTIDYGINLSADYCVGKFEDVDLDSYGVTDFDGRGEGIRVSGDNCYLYRSSAGNTPFIGSGNVIEIRGADCLIENVISYNAGYAGFRTVNIAGSNRDENDDPIGDCKLIDCEARNFRVKGYVNNQNARVVTLDNFKSTFNTDESVVASEHILAESGQGTKFYKIVIKNTKLQNGQSLSNTIKTVSTRHVEIIDSEIVTLNSVSTIRYQIPYIGTGAYEETDVEIRNSILHNKTRDTLHNSDNTRVRIKVFGGLMRKGLGGASGSFFDWRNNLELYGVKFKIDSGTQSPLYFFRNIMNPPITESDPIKVICEDCENTGSIPISFAGGGAAEGPAIRAGFAFLVRPRGSFVFPISSAQRTTARSYVRDYFNSDGVGHFFYSGSYFQKGDRLWKSDNSSNSETDPGWICTRGGYLLNDSNNWQTETAYSVGDLVKSDNRAYQCTTAGTSGTDAISGTGQSIEDGTCVWRFLYGICTLAKMPTLTAIDPNNPLA